MYKQDQNAKKQTINTLEKVSGVLPQRQQSYTFKDTMVPRKRQASQVRATESPETDPYVTQT